MLHIISLDATRDSLMGWDITKAAALHSQLAGLLAGVTVTALALVLSRDVFDREDDEDRSLSLLAVRYLLVAFLVLGTAALEWGVIAGDLPTTESGGVLVRANLAGVFATAGIGLGALQMLFGISALVIRFDERARSTCRRSFQLLAALVAFHLVLTTMDFHTKATGHGQETTWVLVPSALALSYLLVLMGASRTHVAHRLGTRLVERELATGKIGVLSTVGVLTVTGAAAFGLTMNFDAENAVSVAGEWKPLVFSWASALLIGSIFVVEIGLLTLAGVQTWLLGCVAPAASADATIAAPPTETDDDPNRRGGHGLGLDGS